MNSGYFMASRAFFAVFALSRLRLHAANFAALLTRPPRALTSRCDICGRMPAMNPSPGSAVGM